DKEHLKAQVHGEPCAVTSRKHGSERGARATQSWATGPYSTLNCLKPSPHGLVSDASERWLKRWTRRWRCMFRLHLYPTLLASPPLEEQWGERVPWSTLYLIPL